MKNPFKRLNELEDRIADLENINTANKLAAWKTNLENHQKEWELKNPPIFKQGESVKVFEKIKDISSIRDSLTDSKSKENVLYIGKIVCVLSIERYIQYPLGEMSIQYYYVYCIDASDFKFHQAGEASIRRAK
jgi:hypothetical protein